MRRAAADSRSRSRTCAWIVTSSAVVGSSAISSSGSQASAIAIITRCFMPPESWNGYSCVPARGIGNAAPPPAAPAHAASQRRAAPARCGARSTSAICAPTVITGFRLVPGSWKIIAMRRPRTSRIADFGQLQQVVAVQSTAPPTILPGVRQQAHDRQRGHRLAAARFAEQREGLAAADIERHPVHGADDPPSPACSRPDAEQIALTSSQLRA